MSQEESKPLPYGNRLVVKNRCKKCAEIWPSFRCRPTRYSNKVGPKNGTHFWPQTGTGVNKFGDPFRALVCIVAAGRQSLAGKRPRVRLQRCRNRCIHFFAAALRAGRHAAARFSSPLLQSISKEHRFPIRTAVEARHLARCFALPPSGVSVHPQPASVPLHALPVV